MKRLFLSILLICSTLNIFSQSADVKNIRSLLSKQVTAWNAGNVDGFMNGYWQSDSLMFIGKSGITYGWQPTLNNYKKHYPDTASMGKLTFNLLSLKPLSSLYYFVVGKWHLQRSLGNLEGYFTLLFKKIKGTWVIIADHSS